MSTLRIAFNVVNSTDPEANTADVVISNLSEHTRNELLKKTIKPQLLIEAGYDEAFGQIYRGKAIELEARVENTGWTLRAAGKDGLDALRSVVNVSLAPNSTLDHAFEQIQNKLKTLGINSADAVNRVKKGDIAAGAAKLVDGFVGFGRYLTEMDKLTGKIGAEWSIQGEKLEIRLPAETLPGTALQISPSSGLIGSPERIYDETLNKGTKSKKAAAKNHKSSDLIIRFTSLLQPDLRPYARIEMDSREFKGSFRVERVEHVGDTHGQEWSSTVEAKRI